MNDAERAGLRQVIDDVSGWREQAAAALSRRRDAQEVAQSAVGEFRRRVIGLTQDGKGSWRVMPLRQSDGQLLSHVARYKRHQGAAPDVEATLERLADHPEVPLRDVRSLFGARRLISGRAKKDAARAAGDLLGQFHAWGTTHGIPDWLRRVADATHAVDADDLQCNVADIIDVDLGLRAEFVPSIGAEPTLLHAEVIHHLPEAMKVLERAVALETRARKTATRAGDAIRHAETRRLVAEMPIERLKDATRDRVLIKPLRDARITTVIEIVDNPSRLELLRGIGPESARSIRGAAHTLWQTTYDEMPVRIDINARSAETTELLRQLSAWDTVRQVTGKQADLARAGEFKPLANVVGDGADHILVFASPAPVDQFEAALSSVMKHARAVSAATDPAKHRDDPWADFMARPADYFAMLSELGYLTEDDEKAQGDLPDDIVQAIRRLTLNTEHLTASLRGYQSFAARFALVQRRVVIGDEMGLGKTVEALAVLAHLRATGQHRFLVICPAAVVTNWVREIRSKSKLRAHRLHGPYRDTDLRNWVSSGGVAVTTFESLGWLASANLRTAPLRDLACVVVDEAHYVKNPDALRSQRTTDILGRSDYAILLTGTPLENHISEFRTLVEYLRSDLVVDAHELAPRRFRRQVAPAYLRRNQEDVLSELPELVEVDDWLPMSPDDLKTYRSAVAQGNFMAMRQAAMLNDAHSEKVKRLIEIVKEAEDNGRRAIVFSHFREVLERVTQLLPGPVFGPMTGSVAPAARQAMVDEFSRAGHGAVLVSQIVAGGVGLNIQAASVVVICEPQLKPTTEWQAIARAHRMGQLETVQVHRLLSEQGVDQRITEILARKRALFEEFARVSETANSAPEAFDVSEADLAREVVAAERERLFSSDRPPQSDDCDESSA